MSADKAPQKFSPTFKVTEFFIDEEFEMPEGWRQVEMFTQVHRRLFSTYERFFLVLAKAPPRPTPPSVAKPTPTNLKSKHTRKKK